MSVGPSRARDANGRMGFEVQGFYSPGGDLLLLGYGFNTGQKSVFCCDRVQVCTWISRLRPEKEYVREEKEGGRKGGRRRRTLNVEMCQAGCLSVSSRPGPGQDTGTPNQWMMTTRFLVMTMLEMEGLRTTELSVRGGDCLGALVVGIVWARWGGVAGGIG